MNLEQEHNGRTTKWVVLHEETERIQPLHHRMITCMTEGSTQYAASFAAFAGDVSEGVMQSLS